MLKSKVLLFSLLCFFGVSFAGNAVDQLSRKLKSFQTYSANFTQQTVGDGGRVIQTSNGRVSIMPPGQFRWETLKPTHQLLITDGKTLWVYDVGLQQATEQALNKNVRINPASILSGSVSDIQKNFIVSKAKSDGMMGFVLKPKTHNLDFRYVKLFFVGAKLAEMRVDNNLGETTSFKFNDIVLNKPLSAAYFKFTPPANVDVVKQ